MRSLCTAPCKFAPRWRSRCARPRACQCPARSHRPAIGGERDASAGRGGAVRGCPVAYLGGLGVLNARDTPCPQPAECPAVRCCAGPAPFSPPAMGGEHDASDERCWGGRAGRCWVLAWGGGPLPKARTSCPGCACTWSCGATHGTEARACWCRRAIGATLHRPWSPYATGTRPLRRPRPLGRHDDPPEPGAPGRQRVLLVRLRSGIKSVLDGNFATRQKQG